jgi:subtilisin family serine protease
MRRNVSGFFDLTLALFIISSVTAGCIKQPSTDQRSDADIAIPQAAAELGVDTEFLMRTYSRENLEKPSKQGQIVALLKADWRDTMPLKHRSGDVRTFRNSKDTSSITAFGSVDVRGMTLSKNSLRLKQKKTGEESGFEVVRLDLKDLTGKGMVSAINALHTLGSVVLAEPNFEMNAIAVPNDPKWPSLWGMEKIGAPAAWDAWQGNEDFTVAVIDTGIDYTHEDLKDNIWKNSKEIPANNIDDDGNGYVDDVMGWNFYWNNNNPMDGNGHGTHCAGTVAGRGNNGLGVSGVVWGAKLMPVKVLGDDGSGYNFDIYDGIMYAVQNGAHVTSNSYGGGGASNLLAAALSAAKSKGVLFVAAAGNSAASSANYPAYYSKTYDNVIAVASTDANDTLSSFSNYGDGVNVAAPGRNILSTVPNNSYQTYSGTSMATPHVAGLAALLWSKDPSLSYLQVKDALLTGADVIPALTGKVSSGARIHAQKALDKISLVIAPETTPTPDVTPTGLPTAAPTTGPTISPTETPPTAPTGTPTTTPTNSPTSMPTASPTGAPTSTPTSTPTAAPTPSSPLTQGINYSYFTTPVAWSDVPNFEGTTPKKSGLLPNISLSPRTQAMNFGFLFEGWLQIKTAGNYTFYTASDDGSRLWIDNTIVVENGGTHNLRERSGSLYLAAGYHKLKVSYFQVSGKSDLNVLFKGPAIQKQKIPNSALFRE